MLNVIPCPACGRQLHLPDEVLGRQVQCPGCGGSFPARRRSDAPAEHQPALELVLDEQASVPPIHGLPPPPRPLTPVLLNSSLEPDQDDPSAGLARCRKCSARYTALDDRCPACGTALYEDRDERPWERADAPLRRDCEPHRGPLLLSLGRASICLAAPGLLGVAFLPLTLAALLAFSAGLAASLMAHQDLELMMRKEMDPDGERNTRTGQTCGNVGLVIGLIGLGMVVLFRLPLLIAGLP